VNYKFADLDGMDSIIEILLTEKLREKENQSVYSDAIIRLI
jgi:hypothetical protein